MLSDKAALSLQNVSLSYGHQIVIDDVSLDIMQGETFGLIGLNGTGKTTLIKSILGLKDADKGTILIDGKASRRHESKMKIAYLPERFDPPWFLSGIEFLKFSVSLYGRQFDRQEAVTGAEKLALKPEFLKKRVQTYSKGMRQKLGILATLMTGCPILILDEPMSGLDPQARALVKESLESIKERGHTIFLSSHILADMNEICDRVSVVNSRKLAFTGTPAQLMEAGKDQNMERAFLNLISDPAMAA